MTTESRPQRPGDMNPAGAGWIPATQVPRWGQLTYSSFDGGTATGGGWQVKQMVGGLTGAEQEALRSRISTQFDTREAVPQFPSPEEIRALPRRLVHLPSADGTTAAYWHTVHAGVDGSGRPGNVFVHALLDRRPSAAGDNLRPIEFWDSPDWLIPFGPQQVISATLRGADRPAAGPLSREFVVQFLLDVHQWHRLGVLTALLDATAAAIAGGPAVVLGSASPDRASSWIAAVSYLMSPTAARRLGFSTLERLRALTSGTASNLPLVSVPLADLDGYDATTAPFTVISEDEIVELGEIGGAPHRTRAGSEISVTGWSQLADVILSYPAQVVPLLHRMDAIALQVGDTGAHPGWPLAMVTAEDGSVGDGYHTAAGILGDWSPTALRSHPALFRSAAQVVRGEIGDTVEAAWVRLESLRTGDRRSVMTELIEQIYLERALNDDRWLCRPGVVPLPPGYVTPDVPNAVLVELQADAIDRVRAMFDSPSFDDENAQRQYQVALAVLTLRLVDFATRAGHLTDFLLIGFDELIARTTSVVVHRTLGPDCAKRVGALHEQPRELLLIEVAEHRALSIGRLGSRLDPAVVNWLCPVPRNPWRRDEVVARAREITPFDREYAVQVLEGRIESDPERYRSWRFLGVWSMLSDPDPQAAPELATLPLFHPAEVARMPWFIAELLPLVTAFPGRLPMAAFVPALITEPNSVELMVVADRIAGAPADRGREWFDQPIHSSAQHSSVLARFRILAADPWWRYSMSMSGETGVRTTAAAQDAGRLLGSASRLLAVPGSPDFWPGLAPGLLAAFAVFVLNAARQELDPALWPYLQSCGDRAESGEAVDIVLECTRNGVVRTVDLCVLVLRSRLDNEVGLQAGDSREVLVRVKIDGQPMVESVARAAVGELPPAELDHLRSAVERIMTDRLWQVGLGERDASRARGEIERASRALWKDLQRAPGTGLLGLPKLFTRRDRSDDSTRP